eukprot:TRINITY_DN7753_c0_g1_i1.p1 TRINITY_DN7753_c0_g1~~TRINITY_DN7753_c0_g1_i1.p1  ORF type:complete len:713 (-),score=280.76 TRINITY_DN7753_c0_g1_i1:77-1936(-)
MAGAKAAAAVVEKEGVKEEQEEAAELEKKRSKLVQDIKALDGPEANRRGFRKISHNPSQKIAESEFQICRDVNPKEGEQKLGMEDLMLPLRDANEFHALTQQLNKLEAAQSTTLVAPPAAEQTVRENREKTYQQVSKNVSKWQHVVTTNREAKHIQFPLNVQEQSITSTTLVKSFKPQTELEKNVDEVLKKSDLANVDVNEKEAADLKEEEEAQRQTYVELAKLRSVMWQQEVKAKHSAKIKSKKYHQIMKHAKQASHEREVAAIAAEDPEALAEYQDRIERERIKERMTLKHKNTSRWARNLQQKGLTKVPEFKKAIDEQLRKSKQLSEKREKHEEDTDEVEAEVPEEAPVEAVEAEEEEAEATDVAPPTLLTAKPRAAAKQKAPSEKEVLLPSFITDLAGGGSAGAASSAVTDAVAAAAAASVEEQDDEREEEQKKFMAEAFADSNAVEQFEKEKEAVIEEETGEKADKDAAATKNLPGWGSWTGEGTKAQKPNVKAEEAAAAKRKEKANKRKDAGRAHVIIHEKRGVNPKSGIYMLASKPGGTFSTAAQYEASLVVPLGPDWNTSNFHKEVIKPKVKVLRGKVIKPIAMSKRTQKRQLQLKAARQQQQHQQRKPVF